MAEPSSNLKKVEDELVKIEKGTEKELSKIRNVSKIVGPGVVTGASDDDPSGVVMYSATGAQFGLSLSWLTLFAFPMMIAAQELSARIGVVTGKGLAGILKLYAKKPLVYSMVGLLIFANTVNIGADLGAMAESARLLYDIPFPILAIGFAALIIFLEVFISYKRYANILKWLTISLLAYFATALIVTDSWSAVLKSLLSPSFHFDKVYLMVVVGFLGTTISPYLYFWQASEEVEENPDQVNSSSAVSPKQVQKMRADVFLGTLLSQSTAFFIILTTALTLNKNGIFEINSAADAASALEPFAGNFASLLFAIGIIGTGLLGIPVLAGSGAYAVAETLDWKEGLALKFKQAKGFYGVIVASTVVGLLINFIGINPMKALVYAAVVNGVVAVPLIAMMVKIGADKKIMGNYTNGIWSTFFGWLTFAVMGIAAILMFWGFLK